MSHSSLFVRALLLAGLTLAGCSEKDDDGDTSSVDDGASADSGDGGVDSGAPVACETLEVETCAGESDRCWVITGVPVVGDGAGRWCIDYATSTGVGCQSNDVGCDGSIKWAAPPSDASDCHMLGSCVPTGWISCADPAQETLDECG